MVAAMPTRDGSPRDRLQAAVDALAERVTRLEAARPATGTSAVTDGSLVQRMLDELWDSPDGADAGGSVVYAGAGPWADGTVAWQIGRGWTDIREAGADAIASLFGALANPYRIRILRELVTGPVTTSELGIRLDQPSSGRLFHHLKELLAAGVIYQPERGTYAIRREDVIPMLAALSCAIDLASPHLEEESP
jgi:DNA-binding transcriptional ArsR family regulator